jgi:hypothetical protein
MLPVHARLAGALAVQNRWRKLVATIGLVVLVIVWSFAAMLLGQLLLNGVGWFGQLVYYIIGGIGWVVPAMVIIRWMMARDTPRPAP